MSDPGATGIIQMAWVVADLDEAMVRWHRNTGVGPFLVQRHIAISEPRHRGKPATLDFSVGIAQAGPVQVELIEQHDDLPSCYRDTIRFGEEALHHVAIMPDDYDAALAAYLARGHAEASSGLFGDVRFSYIDTSPALGHMTEIVEGKPSIRKFFAAIARAAEQWDGDEKTLLREL